VSRDPNLTTIMTLKSFVERNFEGKHIVLISQEEGCDI
jgi:hypothetical protein